MKKKILITDTTPLYPPLWGGPKRIWKLYSNFSRELFDIIYVGVDFNMAKGRKYSFDKIRPNFKEISCVPAPHYYVWHIAERIIFRNTSLDLFIYLWMHTDWQFKYALNSQNADIIICSHPWSALSVRKNNGQFFIYDAHNCEYLLMEQILGNHVLKSLVLKQLKKIEAEACRKSDIILACSDKEKSDFIKLYKINPDKIIIINNGADLKENITAEEKEACRKKLDILLSDKVIIFVGAYYKPNIEAARFIVERLAPELKDYKFLIVGTVYDEFRIKRCPSNIKFLGRVSEEQLDLAMKASDIAINPMFNGSGINIKMLDYMSYGLPIVTTECGARGIEANGKQPMIICMVDKFTDNIKMLVGNNTLCKQMAEDARTLIAQRYNWKIISKELHGAILERLEYK